MASSEVEFLEERLVLLETWLESTKDDENNEDLIQKFEEYQGLIEETILLQKKLRKTSKLLSTENNEKTLQKLSKKQDQYLCEIEEIMNYAESDVLFETAEIEPNELLGEPLETLMEHPEESTSSLNFSMSDFVPKVARASQSSQPDLPTGEDLQPIAEKTAISTDAVEFKFSKPNSNTYNYDESTLRKKLKKVEKLLAAEDTTYGNTKTSPLDAKQMKKLRKKRQQYTRALQHKIGNDTLLSQNRGGEELEDEVDGGYESKEAKESNLEQGQVSSAQLNSNHDCYINVLYDRKTLRKKMKKLKKIMAATNDTNELEMYKQKKKEYKLALAKLKKEEENGEISSPSHFSQCGELEDRSSRRMKDNGSQIPHKQNKDSSEDNAYEIELLRKKIRKADKSIATARKEDDAKKLNKMEEKRQEYQNSLAELLKK